MSAGLEMDEFYLAPEGLHLEDLLARARLPRAAISFQIT
jgi:hypothetical protein